jgi:hypothetical protein
MRRLSNFLKNERCKQAPSLLLDEMILSNSQNPFAMNLLSKVLPTQKTQDGILVLT